MIQSLFRYLKGYVKIRITGYSPERFLNMCCFHGQDMGTEKRRECLRNVYKSCGLQKASSICT